MVRNVLRGCVLSAVVLALPQVASAQWYVSPYVGKAFKINNPFGEFTLGASTTDTPTVIGVSGGTSPFKMVGIEIDFQRINDMFRAGDSLITNHGFGFGEANTGPNYAQSVTVAAHVGPALAGGRFRPYGVAGGGLNVINLGSEQFYFMDENFFNSRPPAQQIAIANCFDNLPEFVTLAQFSGCGAPIIQEAGDKQVGYRGVMTFGGGALVKVASHFAAKADVRFFKSIPDEDGGPFTFWRFVVGVVIHR